MSAAAPCRAAAFRGQNCCTLQAAALGRRRCCDLFSESDHSMHVEALCGSRGGIILAEEVCGLRSTRNNPIIRFKALSICVK